MDYQTTRSRLHPHRDAALVALTIALLTSACSTLPTTPASTKLAGSSWRLIEFQPASGGPNILPAQPDQYLLDFGVDGRVAAKLDCNRGSGAFTLAPDQGGSTRMNLGPLASTRMMCPPSALGSRLPREIEGERGYRIEGNRLHLDAAASAGVYVWERAIR